MLYFVLLLNTADCTGIYCDQPQCGFGEKIGYLEGHCCPVCVQDCSNPLLQCYLPKCKMGEREEVPEGACCPECVPDIDPFLQKQNNHDESIIGMLGSINSTNTRNELALLVHSLLVVQSDAQPLHAIAQPHCSLNCICLEVIV